MMTGIGLSHTAQKKMRTAFRNAEEEIESEDPFSMFVSPLQ